MPKTSVEPIRVLHIVGGMNRGGVETWLMNMFRALDPDRLHFHFAVASERTGDFDNEIITLGGKIHHLGSPQRLCRYVRNLWNVLQEEGPFDVVHSHVHHFSGITLAVARLCGIKARISHSHSDISRLQTTASWPRKLYFSVTEMLIGHAATLRLAGSKEAAASLYGSSWRTNSNTSIMHTAIDLAPFARDVDRSRLRASLEILPKTFAIGHVGRFAPVKNHRFIVEIAKELRKTFGVQNEVVFILVGDGPLKDEIERYTQQLDISDMFRFLGLRSDVPELMLGGMDAFILPSRHEGLPLVGVEAQAAGLPSLLSDTISTEVCIVPNLVRFLSIAAPTDWCTAIMSMLGSSERPNKADALETVMSSDFDLSNGLKALESAYGVVGPHTLYPLV